jgi:hypothetical protein
MSAKCPNCKKESNKPDKTWKYGIFDVKVFTCSNCNTKFREYFQNGKHAFSLKFEKGKGYIKA